MLKIERKLIEFIERHILVFQLILVSILALYIRRIPIWWNTDDIAAYFDLHENCTQSCLYYLLVRAVQYLPMLPVHSIKWISVIGDFGTAILCLLLVREKDKKNRLLQVFCYTLCLFSPVLFLRGSAWAQIDSLAVMLFLFAWLLWERKKKIAAGIFALLSCLLYPCMIVFVCWYLWSEKDEEKEGTRWITIWGFLIVWLIFCGLTALPLGKSFVQGMENSFAWLTYDPVTGQEFATGLDWILQMLITLGLPGSVIGGLALVRRGKVSIFAVTMLHLLITILYGSRMF